MISYYYIIYSGYTQWTWCIIVIVIIFYINKQTIHRKWIYHNNIIERKISEWNERKETKYIYTCMYIVYTGSILSACVCTYFAGSNHVINLTHVFYSLSLLLAATSMSNIRSIRWFSFRFMKWNDIMMFEWMNEQRNKKLRVTESYIEYIFVVHLNAFKWMWRQSKQRKR